MSGDEREGEVGEGSGARSLRRHRRSHRRRTVVTGAAAARTLESSEKLHEVGEWGLRAKRGGFERGEGEVFAIREGGRERGAAEKTMSKYGPIGQ